MMRIIDATSLIPFVVIDENDLKNIVISKLSERWEYFIHMVDPSEIVDAIKKGKAKRINDRKELLKKLKKLGYSGEIAEKLADLAIKGEGCEIVIKDHRMEMRHRHRIL